MLVYSIFDKKVSAYGQPFFAKNDGAAMRLVMASTTERNSLLATFPGDYQLERIGSWDDEKGVLEPSKPAVVSPVTALLWEGDAPGDQAEPKSPGEPTVNENLLV